MDSAMMSDSRHLPSPRLKKELLDINNNLIQFNCDTSTPLLQSRVSRRHRPEGESPEKSSATPQSSPQSPEPPAASEDRTWNATATVNAQQQQQQQQRVLAAYYSDLMWQSYYATMASMMAQAPNAMMPWRLPNANSQLQEMMAQQQQQQMTLLKWSSQVAQAMQNQRAAAPRQEEANPDGNSRPETKRTRIDMDQFRAELSAMTELYRTCMTIGDSNIERAASTYRTAATTSPRSLTIHWEGSLQVVHPLSVTYSRKVFIGGVPWDIKDCEVEASLREFGRFELLWPQNRERRNSMMQRGPNQPRGYCYLVFEDERQVKALLQRCISRDGATFVRLCNTRSTDKEAQVIPWCIADASFATRGLHSTNAKTTVFVGALHGMITAANLATIMSDTFGDVVCAALDTDRYKYPIGSGRVVFANSESYKKAVEANFLQVKTPKFVKTIQIDPYLEDSMCSLCFYAPGVYFCRSTKCFQYYCPPCWQNIHSTGDEERGTHKPLRRTFRNPIDRKYM